MLLRNCVKMIGQVAIGSLLMRGKQGHIQAGGGIVVRRSSTTRLARPSANRRGLRCGRELRSSRPAAPLSRKRATHLAAVLVTCPQNPHG